MISFEWNEEKNEKLKRDRGISFERILYAIECGDILDVVDHPNNEQYSNQSIYILRVEDYVYLVPSIVKEDATRFLKTIIPSLKTTRDYLRKDEL